MPKHLSSSLKTTGSAIFCDLRLLQMDIVGASMNHDVAVVCGVVRLGLCFFLCDASSTLRLASMSEALASGKQQTVTGDANLTFRVTESPITSVWNLALSVEAKKARQPAGPTKWSGAWQTNKGEIWMFFRIRMRSGSGLSENDWTK